MGLPPKPTRLGALVPTFGRRKPGTLTYYAVAFFALRWWRSADRYRRSRFALWPVMAAGFWGLVLLPLVHAHPWRGALVLVLAAVIVQLASPWEELPPAVGKKMRLRVA